MAEPIQYNQIKKIHNSRYIIVLKEKIQMFGKKFGFTKFHRWLNFIYIVVFIVLATTLFGMDFIDMEGFYILATAFFIIVRFTYKCFEIKHKKLKMINVFGITKSFRRFTYIYFPFSVLILTAVIIIRSNYNGVIFYIATLCCYLVYHYIRQHYERKHN